ncbi:MAG: MBL fold metallo-hydrolase [Brotaphodocola sp.]
MKEIFPNIFHEVIPYADHHISPRNLYIVRHESGRSLMIDTSFRWYRDWTIVRTMIESLGIAFPDLDVFITHNHPDHTGLIPEFHTRGAKVYMNPAEIKERADLMHSYLCDREVRIANLRIMGITEDTTREVYDAFMQYTDQAFDERMEKVDFDFLPIEPGAVMQYGEYSFEVVLLEGHTVGQCGLYEKNHKLLFCGDQIMSDIVPIVTTQHKDLQLLSKYMESLDMMIKMYGDCYILPSHYEIGIDLQKEANRVVIGYLDKCSIMLDVLKQDGEWMTTREVGVRTYGRSSGPPGYKRFTSCTQIWAKTFTCLEFMYAEGFVDRKEYNETVYWKANPEQVYQKSAKLTVSGV